MRSGRARAGSQASASSAGRKFDLSAWFVPCLTPDLVLREAGDDSSGGSREEGHSNSDKAAKALTQQ